MTAKAETVTPPEPAVPAPPQDRLVSTRHTLRLPKREVDYSATVGTMVLKLEREATGENAGSFEGEKPAAEMFFVAYTREDTTAPEKRPVTFVFNGGPGSSSVWLHMGMLGPRRVALDPDGHPLTPPGQLIDNPACILDSTDLVFIDPVSTGYSRPAVGEKTRQFHAFKRDIETMGDFIRLYVTRNKRWASPKFLAGESYGTTRAAGLSTYLQERHGIFLNGLILISTALDFSTLEFQPGNDLPFALYLPTYTATAWYHGMLAPALQKDLGEALRQSQAFAEGEYLQALFAGSKLAPAREIRVARRLAALTGLSEIYVRRSNLRIEIMRYCKELLRSKRRTIGRLDSRFLGIDRDAAGENFEHDPAQTAIIGQFSAMFNDYVRRELNYESDLPYEIITEKVFPWSYAEHENSYVMLGETLRKAMSANPKMKVWAANGYFDLATPYFATEYVVNHLQLEPALRDNLSQTYYQAGHMMYIHKSSLEQLHSDAEAFIKKALEAPAG